MQSSSALRGRSSTLGRLHLLCLRTVARSKTSHLRTTDGATKACAANTVVEFQYKLAAPETDVDGDADDVPTKDLDQVNRGRKNITNKSKRSTRYADGSMNQSAEDDESFPSSAVVANDAASQSLLGSEAFPATKTRADFPQPVSQFGGESPPTRSAQIVRLHQSNADGERTAPPVSAEPQQVSGEDRKVKIEDDKKELKMENNDAERRRIQKEAAVGIVEVSDDEDMKPALAVSEAAGKASTRRRTNDEEELRLQLAVAEQAQKAAEL